MYGDKESTPVDMNAVLVYWSALKSDQYTTLHLAWSAHLRNGGSMTDWIETGERLPDNSLRITLRPKGNCAARDIKLDATQWSEDTIKKVMKRGPR